MKKQIATLVLLITTVISSAQKLSIEKGEIKLDEKTVAYIEGKKPFFKVLNLTRDYSINAELKFLADSQGFGKRWLVLKNENGDKSNELEYKKFSPTNQEKSFVETLIAYNYLDSNGLNTASLNDFFNKTSTGVSEKTRNNLNEVDKESKIIADLKLTIDDNGTIYSIKANNPEHPEDKRIGLIKMTLNNGGGIQKYEVADLDNYIIATWFAEQGLYEGYNKFLNQELITFDKKVFPVKFDNSGNFTGYKMSKDITALNIVKALMINSYTLQHQGKQAVKEIRIEQQVQRTTAINTEKLASKNIYEQNGYVINEKKEKREGPITIEFESIKAVTSNGMADMTAYGKTVTLKYNIEKGRNKTEIFKSKNGIMFCVDNKGNQECYLGLKTIGNTMAAAASLNSLSFDFSSFYKIVYENNGYLILIDPLTTSDFILKIPSQEKGLYTNKSSIEKLKTNFSEYTKCNDLIFENYDFKTKEGLIKVLEDYQTKCKK
ncbi:hypothetical protein [Flavobacterium psychrophilum]|uniref:hypothetical protein n=1 Tax=Flavobacterium psychrophilum TaxID=96345 RepID=UPI00313881E3